VFRPDPGIQYIPATREQVVAIVESINQPAVSIPGRPVQTCAGQLCGIRNANGSFSIFVGLFVPATGENVIYASDRRQLTTVDEYRDVELEGLQFLESMGFMLDNLNYRNLPADAQEKTLRRIPLFSPSRGPAPSPSPTPVPSGPAGAGPVSASGQSLQHAAPIGPGASLAVQQAVAPPADDAGRIARLLASF
jgi:hypothetical protein